MERNKFKLKVFKSCENYLTKIDLEAVWLFSIMFAEHWKISRTIEFKSDTKFSRTYRKNIFKLMVDLKAYLDFVRVGITNKWL